MPGVFSDQGRLFSYISPEARVPAMRWCDHSTWTTLCNTSLQTHLSGSRESRATRPLLSRSGFTRGGRTQRSPGEGHMVQNWSAEPKGRV
jgi:hypothetical protein